MNLCRDCRFFEPLGTYIGTVECNHPKATVVVPPGVDPVMGKRTFTESRWQEGCDFMRGYSGPCGPDGSLFAAKATS